MTEYYSPERREKERRQQHYGDQARIAELEQVLHEVVDVFEGRIGYWFGGLLERMKVILAKG